MIKKLYASLMIAATIFGSVLAFGAPVYAASCADTFFGIPAWYKGMQDDTCAFKGPSDVRTMILRIALNIIQAGMVAIAYVTVFFLIKGGFTYITSAGSSDGMAAAKKTITNAIIGLVIAILAASIVNAIAGAIK
jgi:uncharacterized membrane protein